MGDTSAAIRDPIFFRWHKFIDDLFFLHKIKLPPYTPKELEFTKVRIDSVKVQVKSKVTHILTAEKHPQSSEVGHCAEIQWRILHTSQNNFRNFKGSSRPM